MTVRAAGSLIFLMCLLLSEVRPAAGQSGRAKLTSHSLPGRIVDVRASEFSFQAPDSIPAGLTTFRLHQAGFVVDRLRAGVKGREAITDKGDETRGMHMLWVVRLDSGKTLAHLHDAAKAGERMTPWARQLGGPAFILPPLTTNATINLEPGSYALVCYVGSARSDPARYHLLNGMFRSLTVVPTSRRTAPLPKVDVTATLSGDGTAAFSRPLRAGRVAIRVRNETDEDLEFIFLRMPAGLTARTFLATKGANPGTGAGGLSSVPPRASVITTVDLAAGEYVVKTHANARHPTSQALTVASR